MSSKIRTISTIGIMGFGAFGRLMARHLQSHFALRVCDPDSAPAADASGKGLQPASAAEVAARRDETPDDRLRTEFPFELPYGYVDGDGQVHRSGVMRVPGARPTGRPRRRWRPHGAAPQ